MKFLALTPITHLPNQLTGRVKSATDRLREVVDGAVRAEQLGFDGFGVIEQHERPFISSAPPVVLSHIAARTSAIRLFAAVATPSLRDPVRAFEDYSTLDHLSGGRLELIIGQDHGAVPAGPFAVTAADHPDRRREDDELFRRFWRAGKVTWTGKFRPPVRDAVTLPRPLQETIRIWHGSTAASAPGRPGGDSADRAAREADRAAREADRAAREGDPLFVANDEPDPALVRHYRERWDFYGRDQADVLIGAGAAACYAARTSQQAIATYRPVYDARQAWLRGLGATPAWCSLEDAIERSPILVGSPQQIIDKVFRYHEQLGHEVLHLPADADGLTDAQHQDSQELFFGQITPVLRREIPSRRLSQPAEPAVLVPALTRSDA